MLNHKTPQWGRAEEGVRKGGGGGAICFSSNFHSRWHRSVREISYELSSVSGQSPQVDRTTVSLVDLRSFSM